MAVKNDGLPKTNLKAIDIRDTLNANGGSVSNKTNKYFSSEANINKWSKHKPIIDSDPFLPYDDEKWGEQDGTTPSPIIGLADAFNATSTEDDWFDYTLPSGGTSEPLRMGDFRGYRADAFSAFQTFTTDKNTAINGNSTTFEIYVRCYLNNEEDPTVGGMITLTDLGIFNSSWNTHTLAVIEKFNNTYSLHTGSTLEDNWGYGTITRNWTIDDVGTHEFKAVIHTDNDNNYVLPFPIQTIEVLKYYGSDTLLNPYARIAYASDDTTGSSVRLDCGFTYIRGNSTAETYEFNVQISWGSSSIQSTPLDNVYFTIPDDNINEAGDYEYKFSRTYIPGEIGLQMKELHQSGDLYVKIGNEVVKVD